MNRGGEYMFLESFHETFKLLLALSETRRHLLQHLLLGVLAEPAARLQHLVDVFLLHSTHMLTDLINR